MENVPTIQLLGKVLFKVCLSLDFYPWWAQKKGLF